ncbi:glycosyltransferase family 4 protein [Ancylobacter mangrovi]|uniref:glycosyltransferase family 4 protein n=1 Tax=Ancylobacter mangrovi TaxID=2972472 RepID=UPI002163C2BE|nr:glycosyltransferase family 4 protein [Ancylobacter mangrovi]MCS0503600.1 glycosyltransferase family 4 protein [Ancylobacter mangrovi]
MARDCLAQYAVLSGDGQNRDVRIFCERPRSSSHPDIAFHDLAELPAWLEGDGESVVIYHWRDGNPDFDARFARLGTRRIIRWHNNTPPWFFAPYAASCAANTLRGLKAIREFAAMAGIEFWANSAYSARQLVGLGADPAAIRVVQPLSPLLADVAAGDQSLAAPGLLHFIGSNNRGPLRLLFVGRFVPHKGHRHLVATAAMVQQITGRPVELNLVGRADPAMGGYADEVLRLARELGVSITDHGEISGAAIEHLYCRCDVFLMLSEHEGFGLPVLEAARFGLPVVGVRAAATAEILAGHPLCLDRFDHVELARRAVASCQPAVRQAVVIWQRQELGAGHSRALVTRQIDAAMTGAQPPERVGADAPEELAALVAQALEAVPVPPLPEALEARLRTLPAENPGRLVSLHDIDAYSALIRGEPEAGDLYKATWRQGFPAKRRWSSRVYRAIRRFAFSLNFGLVAAIERSRRDTDRRINHLSEELGAVKQQNAAILQRLDRMLGTEDRAAEPASLRAPSLATVLPNAHEPDDAPEAVVARSAPGGLTLR